MTSAQSARASLKTAQAALDAYEAAPDPDSDWARSMLSEARAASERVALELRGGVEDEVRAAMRRLRKACREP